MKLGNHAYRTIWPDGFGNPVKIIDQRFLPHRFDVVALDTLADAETAIRDMWVRGAPLIALRRFMAFIWRYGRKMTMPVLPPPTNVCWQRAQQR